MTKGGDLNFLIKVCQEALGIKSYGEEIYENMNPYESYFLAIENKISTISSKRIADMPNLNFQVRSFLLDQISIRKSISNAYFEISHTICDKLLKRGIYCFVRKGPAYDFLMFGSLGFRDYSDVDIFVFQDEISAVDECMKDLGFISGRVGYDRENVEPHQRRTYVHHALYPDHIPSYVKKMEFGPTEYVTIDFATEISWSRFDHSKELSNVISNLSKDIEKINGIPVAPLRINALDCMLHAFREAYFAGEHWNNSGVFLKNLLDTALILQKMTENEWTILKGELSGINVAGPIGWVLHHLDDLFTTNFSESITPLFSGDPIDHESFEDKMQIKRMWPGNMFERLSSESPVQYMLRQ